MLFLACIAGIVSYTAAQTQTFTTSDVFTVPAGVTSVTVEAWGAGGGGSSRAGAAGGGGGGAYTKGTFSSLTAGSTIAVTVGTGGAAGAPTVAPGNVSKAVSGANTITANGGLSTATVTGGAGGTAATVAGIITASKAGGAGGNGRATTTGTGNEAGGGGGGSATTTTAGTAGTTGGSSTTTATPGGAGTGTGGNGASADGAPDATAGGTPGAGGGGRGEGGGTSKAGANGQVMLTWTCSGVSVSNFSTAASASCVASGSTITVTSSTLATGTYTVYYDLSGANTATAQSASLSFIAGAPGTGTFTTAALTNAGSTTITINTLGCAFLMVNNTATFTVRARPTSVITGTQNLCDGSTSTNLSVALTGTQPWSLTYTDGTTPVNITGITTSPYTFTVSPSSTKTYTISALSDANCTAQAGDRTGSAVVTVRARPTSVISGTQAICLGSTSTNLSIALTGTQPWSITYTDGTTPVTVNSIAASPYTFTVSPSGTKTYAVSALSDVNCTSQAGDRTGSAIVTVNGLPTSTVTRTSNAGPQFSGANIDCIVTPSGGTGPYSFSWSATNPNGAYTLSPTIGGNSTGFSTTVTNTLAYNVNPFPYLTTVTCIVTDANGCTATGNQTSNIHPDIQTPQGNAYVCQGTTTSVYTTTMGTMPYNSTCDINTDGYCSYDWVLESVPTGSLVGTITSSGSPNNSATITWDPGFAGTARIKVRAIGSGVSGKTQNSSYQSTDIIITQPPTADVSGTQSICNGGSSSNLSIAFTGMSPWSVTYTDGTTPVTATGVAANPYHPTVSPSSTKTYTVTAVSDAVCAGVSGGMTGSGTITVLPRPTSVISGTQAICNGSTSSNLSVALTGTQPWSLTYTDGTTPVSVSGITSSPYTFTVSPTSTKTYTISALSDANCISLAGDRTGSAVVSVNLTPTASSGGSQTICQTSTATVSGATSSNGTILWTHNGAGSLSNATTLTPTYTAAAGDAGNTVTLTMTVSNSPCVAATATYSVIVKASPTATAGGSQTICQNSTATVNGASFTNGTILWTENGLGTISNTTTLTPTYTAAAGDAGLTRTLTMTVSNAPCAAATATYSVIVKATPTATAGGSQNICQTGTAIVSGATSTNGTILWTHNGNGTLTNATTLTPTYTPTAADAETAVTLIMTVSNSPCTAATATYTVNVKGTPTATAGGSQTICQNSTATVSGATSSNGSIAWTENGSGSITSGSTTLTPTYTAAAADAALTRTLTMTVSNAPCAAATATYTVVVKALPTATAGGSATICHTGTATVSGATATGGTILWTHDGNGTLTNATTLTPTYTPDISDAQSTVTLTMSVSNLPCVATATYTVIVKGTPTATAGGTQTICQNSTATVSGATSSNGSIAWTENGSGTITSGAATLTPTYTAAAADGGQSRTLTMTVSNAPCVAATATYTVVVKALPTATAGGTQTICYTGTATVGGATSSGGTILWTHNGDGTLTNATTLTPTYTPVLADAESTVTLTMSVSNLPCVAMATYTVVVRGTPTASAGGTQTICQNSTATVSGATAANGTIAWIENGSGSITSGATTLTPTYTAAAADGGNTRTLTMTVSNGFCLPNATATYSLIVKALPTATAGGSQTICQTGTATVSGATSSGGTILWTHNGAGSLSNATTLTPTYTAAAGDAGNTVTLTMSVSNLPCVVTATYTVIVKASPTATAGGTQTICQNSTATVSGASSSNGTILWTENGSGTMTNTTSLTPTYTAAAGDGQLTRTLTMTVSNAPCTAATATYSVEVKGTPTTANAGPDQINSATCGLTTVTLAGNTPTIGTGLWTVTSGIGGSFANATSPTTTFSGVAGSTYTLTWTISNPPCASSSNTMLVTFNVNPVIAMAADYCYGGGFVRVVATPSITPATYSWNTGATTSSVLTDVAGSFVVTATVTATGCSGSGIISVAQELIANGDFSSGVSGFTTDAQYTNQQSFYSGTTTSGLVPEGLYAVNTNAFSGYPSAPSGYHPNFYGRDHTTGTGNFMMINGSAPASGIAPVVWQQSGITVLPNTDYYFSAWAQSLNNVPPYASLRFSVNGTQVGTTATLTAGPSSNAGVSSTYWIRFYGTWNSGSATSANVSIVDLQLAAGGNDFGLDDISFGTLSTFVTLTSLTGTNAQTVCASSPITNITYKVGGGLAGPTVTGLPSGVTSSFNGITLTITGTPTVAGTYTYTATTTGSCAPSTASGTITVNPLPVPVITFGETSGLSNNDGTICTGDAVTLTATPASGMDYAWSSPGGTTSAITVSPSSSTSYTVTLTNSTTACVATKNATVTVNTLPTPTIAITETSGTTNNDGTTCAGAAVTLTASPSSGVSYSWSSPGGSAAALSVSPTTTTSYTVTVTTTANGCRATQTASVTVNAVPAATISYTETSGAANNDGIICTGASVTLTTTPASGVTYAWSSPGGTTSSISVTPSNTTSYTVTVTNPTTACRAIPTGSVTVNGFTNPTISYTETSGLTSNDGVVCAGSTTTIHINPSSGMTYTWPAVPGGTGSSKTVSPTSTTSYSITATTASGCSASATATVTVNSNPTQTTELADCIMVDSLHLMTGVDSNLIVVTASGGIPPYEFEGPSSDHFRYAISSNKHVFSAPMNHIAHNFTVEDAVDCFSAPGFVITNSGSPTTIPYTDTAGMETTTCHIHGFDNWITFKDTANKAILSIHDNNQDLGLVTATIYKDANQPQILQTGTAVECSGNYSTAMKRHFVLTSTAAQPFASDVQVRLYFTDAELDSLKVASIENNIAGGINCTMSDDVTGLNDLYVTKYDDPNTGHATVDGNYNNNLTGAAGGIYKVYGSPSGMPTQPNGGLTKVAGGFSSYFAGAQQAHHYVQLTVREFSEFWLHGSTNATPLPVEMLFLEAEAINNDHIQLRWATALEVNNSGFEVQRSTDGQTWTKIGWVEGHNNTTVTTDYSFNDNTVAPNIRYYYRLKQIDNDLAFEFTDVVTAIIYGEAKTTVRDFMPNPATDKTNLVITTTAEQTITVDFYDLLGQKVMSEKHQLNKGSNIIEFDTRSFASGTYTALVSGNETVTKKLVKTK